jgi:hypothetical protein
MNAVDSVDGINDAQDDKIQTVKMINIFFIVLKLYHIVTRLSRIILEIKHAFFCIGNLDFRIRENFA